LSEKTKRWEVYTGKLKLSERRFAGKRAKANKHKVSGCARKLQNR